jgi:hypothetical protein
MSYLIATIGIVAFWLVGGGRRARAQSERLEHWYGRTL